jgi:hypothetical protein
VCGCVARLAKYSNVCTVRQATGPTGRRVRDQGVINQKKKKTCGEGSETTKSMPESFQATRGARFDVPISRLDQATMGRRAAGRGTVKPGTERNRTCVQEQSREKNKEKQKGEKKRTR